MKRTKFAGVFMKRNLSLKINSLLTMFPIVAVIGVRQCGKTTLAKNLKPDWLYIDLEKPTDFNMLDFDPEFFFEKHPKHIIIDEAQLYPKLFAILRGIIDADREQTGRFILTGSSSPELIKNITESLAGRIAIVELGTFKANEIFAKPLSNFYQILQQPLTANSFAELGVAQLSLQNIQTAWLQGGYPEPILKNSKDFYLQWMENYENTYINRDLARLYPKLNKIAYQRFLSILCKLSGTILNKSDLARTLEISEGTVREYLKIAEDTFLWRAIPSYEKSKIKSIIKMPKGNIRDSGLLHTLLRITNKEQLFRDPIIGLSFEGFVIEELIKGLQATMLTHWSYYYYRTRGGAEVDLILTGPFGVLPIEIKYGSKITKTQLVALEDFALQNNSPFALLINQAKEACWLNKTVFQLPVNYL